MIKKFQLFRNLKAGMSGEDVKKLQLWLNTVNSAYSFSQHYPDGIPISGLFQTFILNIFYHEYLKWSDYPVSHIYDKEIHSYLCTDVNLALKKMGSNAVTWMT
jgi:hypothetical protein